MRNSWPPMLARRASVNNGRLPECGLLLFSGAGVSVPAGRREGARPDFKKGYKMIYRRQGMNRAASGTVFGSAMALAAVLALALTPSGSTGDDQGLAFYGMVEAVHRDAGGSMISSNVVHNRVVDSGEEHIIDLIFKTGNSYPADNERLNTICITDTDQSAVTETLLSGQVSPSPAFIAGGIFETCIEVSVVNDTDDSIAVMGPEEFVGGTHAAAGSTVRVVAICHNAGDSLDTCENAGALLFSAIPLTDTVLNDGETLDITYTFDASSETT
ncbi:hypothetical protein CENSYa_1938 [Cenarchaeum symbiosum A]|uniref:Uncharacterized protein n=1 Tax=Cenarchaeum symbiosum (strain A) TaxID=414004 RepID=A0RYX9_CENSY|nr:hypothetical protein CENSYa_1938 [Cenarchaeum symbiosum A]